MLACLPLMVEDTTSDMLVQRSNVGGDTRSPRLMWCIGSAAQGMEPVFGSGRRGVHWIWGRTGSEELEFRGGYCLGSAKNCISVKLKSWVERGVGTVFTTSQCALLNFPF
jgi:hypothetical protein